MTPRRSDARHRILREAMRLFAEQGYERTSVADIHAAAGLTPGSGAMYKHYPSKESLLRAGMDQFIEENVQARALLRDPAMPADEALAFIAQEALRRLGEVRDEMRVAWRELEPFPELQGRVRREVMQANYRTIARWLKERTAAGEFRAHDAEAAACVMLGSLVMFRLFEALWGEKILPVSDARFAAAWTELFARALQPPAAGRGSER